MIEVRCNPLDCEIPTKIESVLERNKERKKERKTDRQAEWTKERKIEGRQARKQAIKHCPTDIVPLITPHAIVAAVHWGPAGAGLWGSYTSRNDHVH